MSKLFCFNAGRHLRYDLRLNAVDPGYPLLLGASWPTLPASGVDAAINWGTGRVDFFANDQCYSYSTKLDRVEGRQLLSAKWPGAEIKRVDACLLDPDKRKAYLFRADQYWQLDMATDAIDAGFPKPIAANWPGLFPTDIDGAFNAGTGKAFFFKGADYTRFDLNANNTDPGFPKPIPPDWPNLFATGVRAPVVLGYAGFDRAEYPGDTLMNTLWAVTNLRWCGYYFGSDSWKEKARLLRMKGWGLAPVFVPAVVLPAQAPADSSGVIGLARNPRNQFISGSVLYLRFDPPGTSDLHKQYYAAWVAGITDKGYTPGFHCPSEMVAQFRAVDARPVFWVSNVAKYPTGVNAKHVSPLPAPEPTHSGVGFASQWQLSEKTNVFLSPTASLSACNLHTSCVADPSVPS